MTADYTPRLEYDASCELPEPHAAYWNPAQGVFTDCRLFTADQMRAYAAQAVSAKDAEIERLKSTVLELQSGYQKIAEASDLQMRDGDLAREIADRMRTPEPFSLEEAILMGDDSPKYTARDMLQAVAAERERCVMACRDVFNRHWHRSQSPMRGALAAVADECAAAIGGA